MTNLQEKLNEAVAAYNQTAMEFEKVRESLLQQQGSIQMLQQLIQSQVQNDEQETEDEE